MFDIKMEVYNPNLELLDILEVFSSMMYEEKAFTAGSFLVDSPLTEKSRTLLVPDNILWFSGNVAGIIEEIEEMAGSEGDSILVRGPLLTGILARRILWGRYDLSGKPATLMRYLVEDCAVSPTKGDIEARKIPNLILEEIPSDSGNSIRKQKTGGSLLEALEELGETNTVSYGVFFDPQALKMKFQTRKGVNRSINQTENDPVFFSTELDDVLSSEYTYNSSDYKNVALVAGEGEGEDRVMVVVNADMEPGPTPPEPITMYTVTLSVTPDGGGTVTGDGEYEEGKQATVIATPNEGYRFVHWIDGDGSGDRLPAGYTELQYIQSSGTEYINTGVYATTNTRVLLDFQPMKLPDTGTSGIFGTRDVNSSTAEKMFALLLQNNSRFRTDYFGTSIVISTVQPLQRIILDKNKSHTSINGEMYENTAISDVRVSNYPMGVFCYNRAGDFVGPTIMKVYSMKIYENETIVREYIPCANPSNTVGLYDLIDAKFYANDGTGAFTAGPAV